MLFGKLQVAWKKFDLIFQYRGKKHLFAAAIFGAIKPQAFVLWPCKRSRTSCGSRSG